MIQEYVVLKRYTGDLGSARLPWSVRTYPSLGDALQVIDSQDRYGEYVLIPLSELARGSLKVEAR